MKAPRTIKAEKLKAGWVYSRDGYTVFYSGGFFHFSTFEFENQGKFRTIKEVINHIKSI